VNSHKVDGFILNRIRRHDWRVSYLAQWGIPFAGLGRSHDGIAYPCLRIEAADVYLQLVQHIRGNGFSRFAFIGGPDDLINQIDRLRWFKTALKKCGRVLDPRHLVTTDMSSTGAYEAVSAMLSQPSPPDALLCVNDQTAYGALHAAHEKGLQIGRDIAVAGFDGLRESSHTEPPLTTLSIPMSEVAHRLVAMLLNKPGSSQASDQELIVKPELCIRASTGG
jgi:LacI family transcriptional regulator